MCITRDLDFQSRISSSIYEGNLKGLDIELLRLDKRGVGGDFHLLLGFLVENSNYSLDTHNIQR